MKKKTITIGALLLAMNSFSQSDTLASSVCGKNKYEFDYYTSEVRDVVKPRKYQDFKFKLRKNEILYIDLLDDVKQDTLYLTYRDVTVYYRDGDVEKLYFKSNRNLIEIKGEFIKKVIVHKQELK